LIAFLKESKLQGSNTALRSIRLDRTQDQERKAAPTELPLHFTFMIPTSIFSKSGYIKSSKVAEQLIAPDVGVLL
jgi:hypothetical protein